MPCVIIVPQIDTYQLSVGDDKLRSLLCLFVLFSSQQDESFSHLYMFAICRDRHHLKVREHKLLGPYVDGLQQLVASSAEEVQDLMSEGSKSRTVAATKMNAESSRSHAVFTLIVTHSISDEASQVRLPINVTSMFDNNSIYMLLQMQIYVILILRRTDFK